MVSFAVLTTASRVGHIIRNASRFRNAVAGLLLAEADQSRTLNQGFPASFYLKNMADRVVLNQCFLTISSCSREQPSFVV